MRLIAILLLDKMESWDDADEMIFFMSVDGTHFRIPEPRPWSTIWSSHNGGGKAAVNFEIGLSISRPKLLWLYGPTPPGAMNDLDVAREHLIPAVWQYDGRKRVMADGIYSAQEFADVFSTKNPFDPVEMANFKNRVAARHEAFNGLLKCWKVLGEKFPLECDFHVEAVLVITCCQLDNNSYSLFDAYPVY